VDQGTIKVTSYGRKIIRLFKELVKLAVITWVKFTLSRGSGRKKLIHFGSFKRVQSTALQWVEGECGSDVDPRIRNLGTDW
jgi:hypothetical protein